MSTFGAEKTREVDTYVVNFKVKAKDGSYLSLSANVLKQITAKKSTVSERSGDFKIDT